MDKSSAGEYSAAPAEAVQLKLNRAMAFTNQNSFPSTLFSSCGPSEQPPPMSFARFGAPVTNVSKFGQLGGFDFMNTTSANLTAVKASGDAFGTTTASTTSGFFGALVAPAVISHPGSFDVPTSNTSSGIFGASTTGTQVGIFGSPSANTSSGIFGTPAASASFSIFSTPLASTNSGIFGAPAANTNFGFGVKSAVAATNRSSVVFGATAATTSSGIFVAASTTGTGTNSGFSNALGATTNSSSGSFDTSTPSSSSGIFGARKLGASGSSKIPGSSNPSSVGFFGVSFTDGSSHKTFGVPSGSTPGGFHGGFQTTSVGFSGASSSSQNPGSSNPSSGGQFGSHTFSGGSFPVSSSISSGSGYFGKPAKSDEHEASKHVSFRKVSAEDEWIEKSGAGSNRDTIGKARIPDLMSLSPGRISKKDARSGAAPLFGMAMTGGSSSSDQNRDRGGLQFTSDGSQVKGRSPQPSSSRHVTLGSEDTHVDRSRSSGPRVLEKSGDYDKDAEDEGDAKPEPGHRRRRLVSSDADMKMLLVKGIPVRYNNQVSLKRHFSAFGTVLKIYVNPKMNSATILYKSHASAEKAKEKGRFMPGIERPLEIFWRHDVKQRTARRPSVSFHRSVPENDEAEMSKDVSPSRSRSVKAVAKTEVEDELASMQGTADLEEMSQQLVDRPLQDVFKHAVIETNSQTRIRTRTPPPAAIKASVSLSTVPPTRHFEESLVPPVNTAAFKSLLGVTGQTAGERFAILDNRDKLLRAALGNQKQADLATAKAVRGTCQDMCPEKERYMREDRRRLSAYEIIPGSDQQTGKLPQVDHGRAVKEYSRSSADQDMPLPQELRPPEVLHATMNYLLSYIIETGGQGKWAEWYDFLWNRTRSIRKDITQQHLCDPVAVSLVEKCARFHIFCSEALCEEDVAVFDPKINNENLTKCLQTLKEMYHDLHVRQNVTCLENEAEFCMYMVLMNLNKGDILREVQQLNAEVRSSPFVHFSIQVYSALNSTNYVRFFKLIRVATFLGACILHRYFNQIRTSALQRIIKAYSQPGHSTTYPVSEFLHQLGFETQEEVENFCRHHGLSVENGQVLLDKTRFSDSEVFPVCRSHSLVEGKQMCGLGEVISGRPLSPCIIGDPTSSFDETGHFKCGDGSSGVEAKQPEISVPPVVVTAGGDLVRHQTAPVQLAISNELVKDCARELILEVINEVCRNVSQSATNEIQSLLYASNGIFEEILTATTGEMIRDECRSVLADCRRELEEQLARQRALLSVALERICSDLADDVVTRFIREIASEEHRAITEVTRRWAAEAATEVLVDELLQQICFSDSKQICHEIFDSDVTLRLQTLKDCQRKVEILTLGRVFRKWRAQFSTHQRQRKAEETFPSAPSMDDWPSQLASLIPSSNGIVEGGLHLGGSVFVTMKPPQEIFMERVQLSNDISHSKAVARWQHNMSWLPFDLIQMLTDLQMPQKFTFEIKGSHLGSKFYWKLVVALPVVKAKVAKEEKLIHDWLMTKFSQGIPPPSRETEQMKVLSVRSSPLREAQVVCTYSSINVCVVTVVGAIEESSFMEKNHLLGSSGILFVLQLDFTDTVESWKRERIRLESLLAAKLPVPKIPVAVVCTNLDSSAVQGVSNNLDLDVLKKTNKILDYKVFCLDSNIEDPQTSNVLETIVSWMMTSCPKPLRLTGLSLRDFVEDGLSNRFFTPVLENLVKRRQKGLLHLNPGKLINMYNGVINWLASVASCSKLREMSWPVIEFSADHRDLPGADWNSVGQLQRLYKVIRCLTLPDFVDLKEDTDEWSEAKDSVWNYVGSITDIDKSNSQFFNRIGLLVQQAEYKFKVLCRRAPWSTLEKCPLPLYANFPWLDFIMICIEYRLDCLLSSDKEIEDLKVYYLPDAVEIYCDLSVALEAELDKSAADEAKLVDTVVMATKRKRLSLRDELVLPSSKKYVLELFPKSLDSSETFDKHQQSLDQLEYTVKVEKKQSAAFEEYLKQALDLNTDSEPLKMLPSVNISNNSAGENQHHKITAHQLPSNNCSLSKEPFRSNSGSPSPCSSPGGHSPLQHSLSLIERVHNLKMSVQSEKTASRRLEMLLEKSLLPDFK